MTQPSALSEQDIYAAVERAHDIAPPPNMEEEATTETWMRYYVAQALATYTAFRDAVGTVEKDPVPGSRPDMVSLAVASTAAAVAIDGSPDVAAKLWELTPEHGALNGEWEDWLIERAVHLGINPAHINHYLDPADFELWAVHVAGPDDVVAVADHDAAVVLATDINTVAAHLASRADASPLDPRLHATVIPWPHSRADHATALAEFIADGEEYTP